MYQGTDVDRKQCHLVEMGVVGVEWRAARGGELWSCSCGSKK